MLEHLEHLCNAGAAGGTAEVSPFIHHCSSGSSLLQEELKAKLTNGNDAECLPNFRMFHLMFSER